MKTLIVITLGVTLLTLTTRDCETEDSHNCYWIASERGNEIGDSFVDIGGVTLWLTR